MKRRKRITCILLLAVLLLTSACGKSNDSSEKDVPLSTLQEKMLAADTTLPDMIVVSSEDEKAEENFLYLSDLNYNLVDSYFYACAQAVAAEEIAVIKLKDANSAADMMESLHSHVTQRQGTFQEYAPDQVPLTENAVIIREGRYVALIICEKNGLVQNTFRACFQ